MTSECANPLLLQWSKEWWDQAREQNSKGALTYKKAYESIRACPIPFQHPSQAQQLRGLGPKLCERLTKRLQEHCLANGLPMPEDPQKRPHKRPSEQPGDTHDELPTRKARKTRAKPYVPALRSGAYAIVLALSTLPESTDSGLTKNQTIAVAEAHCNSSFLAPSDPNKTYTAWSSMRTLQEKDLVFVTGGATKRYALTEDGWEVARKMRTAADLDNSKILNPNSLSPADAPKIPLSLSQTPALAAAEQRVPTEGNPVPIASKSSTFIDLGDSEDEFHASTSSGHLGTRPSMRKIQPNDGTHVVQQSSRSEADGTERLLSRACLLPTTSAQVNRQITRDDDVSECYDGVRITNVPDGTARGSASLELDQATCLTTKAKQMAYGASSSSNSARTIVLPPDSYTIELLLDNREVRSKSDRTYLQDGLLAQGVKPTTRALELGDCTWVARVHDPRALALVGATPSSDYASHSSLSTLSTNDLASEFVLDHLVERKRLDDLIASLKDGRFHEQKFRLRRSGARHITYLIEETALAPEVSQRWQSGIRSALASTVVVDRFSVVRTRKLDDSIRWLARTTRALRAYYAGRALRVLTATGLDALEEGARTRREADLRLNALREDVSGGSEEVLPSENNSARQEPHAVSGIAPGVFLSYPAFASRAAKQEGLSLRDVFLKMLLCVRGVSADKALAVQRKWPTPQALCRAYTEGTDPSVSNADAGEPKARGQEHEQHSYAAESTEDQRIGGPSLLDHKHKAEMLWRATGTLGGRQRVGKAVSARAAEVWGGIGPIV